MILSVRGSRCSTDSKVILCVLCASVAKSPLTLRFVPQLNPNDITEFNEIESSRGIFKNQAELSDHELRLRYAVRGSIRSANDERTFSGELSPNRFSIHLSTLTKANSESSERTVTRNKKIFAAIPLRL